MDVETIKEAIAALPEDDRIAIAGWLNSQTMDEWDREMDRDLSAGGRGDHLLAKVRADIRAGKFRPLSDRPTRE